MFWPGIARVPRSCALVAIFIVALAGILLFGDPALAQSTDDPFAPMKESVELGSNIATWVYFTIIGAVFAVALMVLMFTKGRQGLSWLAWIAGSIIMLVVFVSFVTWVVDIAGFGSDDMFPEVREDFDTGAIEGDLSHGA